mmetsp:Transcript_23408/g.25969  ORF Transcript_23408/g.25969 Transcript_23408/m.25969 type:complete len:231 (-) Transcript_23408:1225-1917(-)
MEARPLEIPLGGCRECFGMRIGQSARRARSRGQKGRLGHSGTTIVACSSSSRTFASVLLRQANGGNSHRLPSGAVTEKKSTCWLSGSGYLDTKAWTCAFEKLANASREWGPQKESSQSNTIGLSIASSSKLNTREASSAISFIFPGRNVAESVRPRDCMNCTISSTIRKREGTLPPARLIYNMHVMLSVRTLRCVFDQFCAVAKARRQNKTPRSSFSFVESRFSNFGKTP